MKHETIPETYSVGLDAAANKGISGRDSHYDMLWTYQCERPVWAEEKEGGDLRVLIGKKTVWGEHIMTTKTGSRHLSVSLFGVLWSLSLENSITGKQHEMWRTWALSQLFFPLLWPNPSTSKERWYLSTHSLRVQSTMTGKEGQAAGHIGPSQEAERMHGGPQLHFLLRLISGTPTFGRIPPHRVFSAGLILQGKHSHSHTRWCVSTWF